MVSTARNKAIQWIDQNMKLVTSRGDPYELAVVAYALMLSKASSSNYAFDQLASKSRSEGKCFYVVHYQRYYVPDMF